MHIVSASIMQDIAKCSAVFDRKLERLLDILMTCVKKAADNGEMHISVFQDPGLMFVDVWACAELYHAAARHLRDAGYTVHLEDNDGGFLISYIGWGPGDLHSSPSQNHTLSYQLPQLVDGLKPLHRRTKMKTNKEKNKWPCG